MDNDNSEEATVLTTSVVETLYNAALDTSSLPEIFEAWDQQVLDPVLQDGGGSNSLKSEVSRQALMPHVSRALEIFEITKKINKNSLQEFLNAKVYAAMATTLEGEVIAANKFAVSRLGLDVGRSLFDLDMEVETLKMFRDTLHKLLASKLKFDPQLQILRCLQKDGNIGTFVIEILRDHGFLDLSNKPIILLKSCVVEWSLLGEEVIQKAYSYSKSELDVLRLLCDGLTLQDIAKKRQRAKETIRKQLAALLNKSGVNSQSELIRLITGILHVCQKTPIAETQHYFNWHREDTFQRTHTFEISSTVSVQCAHYGATNGTPVLYIQGNTSPLVPRTIVTAVSEQGLQIISPFKPGSGETSEQTNGFSPQDHVKNCLTVMQQLGFESFDIAGQCMGGVYALEAVKAFPDRIRRIVLVDTGAPMKSIEAFASMPPTSRRTMMVARETPDILITPYTMAADLFFKGGPNEDVVMQITYAESEKDLKALQHPLIRQCVKRNLTYILSDPKRTVKDLIYWMQDWTDLLNDVTRTHKVVFIHGENHDWLKADNIKDYCQNNEALSYQIIPGGAQLHMYEQPDIFAAALKDTFIPAAA